MSYTVAKYLKSRLEELNLDRLFGVAGNYTAPLLDTILEDSTSPIVITGSPNELCAGYAADAYARLRGIGAVAVTYGVGAFSLLNAIAGSMVEQVPVVVINGAPTNKEFQNQRQTGLLYSHMSNNPLSDLNVYREVTVSAQRITNAGEAPHQIDAALTACITQGLPVYLEVLEDVWRAACRAPEGKLTREQRSKSVPDTDEAIRATLEMVKSYGKPLFWAGVEIQRQGLQAQFLRLLERTGIGYTTSLLGKSIVSENTENFFGVYNPKSPDETKELVDNAGCLIGLGAWTTGKDTGNELIQGDKVALAAHGGVTVGPRFFPNVPLKDYILSLTEVLARDALKVELYQPAPVALAQRARARTEGVTYDTFFTALGDWLTADHVVVSDAGFALLGAQNLHIPAQNGFVAQASWLAIGYSVAAAIGVKCAMPDKRPVVVVGDGAFQETCQAVSNHNQLRQGTVVFVLANGIYGIEQKLVNPNPFRSPPVKYPDSLLNEVFPYNTLHGWAYEKLAEVCGGQGRVVSSPAELAQVLEELNTRPDDNFVVHVKVPATDTPAAAKPSLAKVGEDETQNKEWPPKLLF